MRRHVASLLVLAASLSAVAVPVLARQPAPRGDFVSAESRFGHGTVSGPVRYTANGRQVRLPGGSWIYCRATCSDTLREETVDFWEAHERGGGAGARFGVLDYLWRR